jgi:hypothetical protein
VGPVGRVAGGLGAPDDDGRFDEGEVMGAERLLPRVDLEPRDVQCQHGICVVLAHGLQVEGHRLECVCALYVCVWLCVCRKKRDVTQKMD